MTRDEAFAANLRLWEERAPVHAASVDQHRARAALAMVAALFRAGQAQMLATQIEEGGSDIDLDVMRLTIDCEMHGRIPFGIRIG